MFDILGDLEGWWNDATTPTLGSLFGASPSGSVFGIGDSSGDSGSGSTGTGGDTIFSFVVLGLVALLLIAIVFGEIERV
jgi:amino acid transporter